MKTIVVNSAGELKRAGELLGKAAIGGEVIVLSGQLGAGKTTFAQGVASGLNINEAVTSPTFTLIHTYQGRLDLVHCDFYRLKNVQEAINIGFLDYMRRGNVVLVEWGEDFIELLPLDYIHVWIKPYEDGRIVEVKSASEQSNDFIESWVNSWQC